MDLTTLFCEIDDFCKIFLHNNKNYKLNFNSKKSRNRKHKMCLSEILTIVIYFQMSGYRNFKYFYTKCVLDDLTDMFPNLLSYNRFVAIMPTTLMPLACFLQSKMDVVTGISYIDSTKIAVCNNKRINRNKVFENVAKIGKSSMGWFFGFKLHLITNHLGGLLAVKLTPGNTSDSKPVFDMAEKLFGFLFGDKGYISRELFEKLQNTGVKLITSIRSNMKNKLLSLQEKILLRKRAIIETVNDQLKNIYQVEHTRHRSIFNFGVNLLASLIAYTLQPKKPAISDINLDDLYDDSGKILIA